MPSSRFSIGSWLCSLLALLLPAVARAADALPAAPLAPLADELARVVAEVLGLVVLTLVGLALQAVRERLHLDHAMMSDEWIATKAERAAEYAEEHVEGAVASLIKEQGEAAVHRVDGAAKLTIAAQRLRAWVPGLTDEQAREHVLAALPRVGFGAAAPQTAVLTEARISDTQP